VLHNAHVQAESDPGAIRAALVRQVASPVRWVETIQTLAAHGIETLIECGPGKVLTALNKRTASQLRSLPIHDPPSLSEALALVGANS
jgi:[acyl-carrier-protein] S-malonyltransferase